MTTTTFSQYGDLSYSEILAPRFLAAKRPKMVMMRHLNLYSIAGMPSDTLKLTRYNYLGRASAGTEGVPFNIITQLGASSITPQPSEYAIAQGAVTADAIAKRLPGYANVDDILANGTEEEKANMVFPEAMQLANMVFEKQEYDACALLSGLSRSKGTTAQALDVNDFEDGLYTLEVGETLPHENIVSVLSVSQQHDLAADCRTQVGIPFTRDLATIVEFRPDLSRDGLKGAVLGVPVYQMSPEVTQYTGANDVDAIGGIFLDGQGSPEMDVSGYAGCFAFVEGRTLWTTITHQPRDRGAEIQVGHSGDHIERVDNWGVKFVTRSARS